MIDILQKQYTLVKGSRAELLNFVENQVGAGLNAPVAAFDGRTIRYLLVHNAYCYFHWLKRYALKLSFELPDNETLNTIEQIRQLFDEVDKTVAKFLQHFDGQPDLQIDRTLPDGRQVSATPLEIFTHVITHEFHHKGQILSMCRLLGFTPPDTDIIRF